MEKHQILLNTGKSANIYFLGDIHEGNCNSRVDLLEKAVKIVKDDDIGYWYGMGDYIDAILHTDSKRFDPSTIHPSYRLKDLKNLPILQVKNVFERLEPIKDKCLGLLIGNHEASCSKFNSVDVYKYLIELMSDKDAKRMKELTLGYVCIGQISLSRKNRNKPEAAWTVALQHGDGGTGFLPGYPVSKVYEMFRYYITDINVMGHIHQLYGDSRKYLDYNAMKGSISKVRRCHGVCGTFLETYIDGNANYFEGKGRSEGDVGFLKVELNYTGGEHGMTLEKFVSPQKIILG